MRFGRFAQREMTPRSRALWCDALLTSLPAPCDDCAYSMRFLITSETGLASLFSLRSCAADVLRQRTSQRYLKPAC